MTNKASNQIVFSVHALEAMSGRGIKEEWVIETLHSPATQDEDQKQPGRMRAYRPIDDADGKILRVVYILTDLGALRVITAFFDRGAKR